MSNTTRNFLALTDLTREDFLYLIDLSVRLKDQTRAGVSSPTER